MTEQIPTPNPVEPTVQPVEPSLQPAHAAVQAVDSNTFVTLGSALILCVVTCIFSVALTLALPSMARKFGLHVPAAGANQGNQGKVVYLDFDKVLNAGIQKALKTQAASREALTSQADAYQASVKQEVSAYTNAGFVVINRKAVIGETPGQDITPAVIHALGAD